MKTYLYMALFILIAAVACGGQATNEPTRAADNGDTPRPTEVAPTTPPEPTEAPDPTPEPDPTATDAPAVTLGERINLDVAGFSFRTPAGYEAELNDEGAEFRALDAAGERESLLIAGGPLDDSMTPESFYEEFVASLADEGTHERRELDSGVGEGFVLDFDISEDGEAMHGRIALITTAEQGVMLNAMAPADRWDAGLGDAFDALLGTVELYAPVAAHEDGNAGGDDMADADDDGGDAPLVIGMQVQNEPGPACFGSAGAGLTCLSADGEWQFFGEDNSALPSDYITTMAACPDGTMLLGHTQGVTQFDGEIFRNFPESDDFFSPDALACAADGSFWVAHFEGVSHFADGAWTLYDASYLGDETLVYDVGLTPDGTLWVVTSNTVASFDGADWALYATGDGLDDTYFFESLAIDAAGRPWVAHGDGLLVFEDGAWTGRDSGSYISPTDIAIDATGQIWLGSFSDGLAVYDGAAWLSHDRVSGALMSNGVESVVVDGNGRVWAGTNYGLSVRDQSGWHSFRMDNAPLVDNEIPAMVILGGGPALPEPMTRMAGAMVGSVVYDGAPYADALVEICVESLYSFFSGDTPCSDQAYFQRTFTDSSGAFAFEDVPPGHYVLVIETDEGWAQLTSEFGIGSEMIPVGEDDVTDVGELTITSE